MQISLIMALTDIIIVSILIYYGLLLLRATRAMQLILGIVFIAIILNLAYTLSESLGFVMLSWVLKNTVSIFGLSLPVILVVIFQPELRRFIGTLGTKRNLFRGAFNLFEVSYLSQTAIEEIVKSITILSQNRIGALIIIEREISLEPFLETGVRLDSQISHELIVTILTPSSLLHDGAILIKNNKLVGARVILPLTDNLSISKDFGTRHRAGIGITEESDAISLIVSEKDGRISLSVSGKITTNLTSPEVREILTVMCKTRREKKSEL